jgi:hypothetical protein
MLNALLTCLVLLHPGEVPAPPEPLGIHPTGTIPSFQAEPMPPVWLRLDSHVLADPDCRHFGYEVYAGDQQWLVRYVMFPEQGEDFRELEMVFLYPQEKGKAKVVRLAPGELQVEPRAVRWRGRSFPLVDRRDLIRE